MKTRFKVILYFSC